MDPTCTRLLRQTDDSLRDAVRDVEALIMRTPTGPVRNKLADANLFAANARAALGEAARLAGSGG